MTAPKLRFCTGLLASFVVGLLLTRPSAGQGLSRDGENWPHV